MAVAEPVRTVTGGSGAPFDVAAADYDREFTATEVGTWLRDRVHEILEEAFPVGCTVLDLGCGTGEDAVRLALRGHEVEAVDASGGMLECARRKAEETDVGGRIRFRRADLESWPGDRPFVDTPVDGALSNFGVINCLEDLAAFGSSLRSSLKPGARAILVPMGGFFLLETLVFLLRGRVRLALHRRSDGSRASVGGGGSTVVRYPSTGAITRALGEGFVLRRTRALGLCVPPPGLWPAWERRVGPGSALRKWEARWADRPGALRWADHRLLVYERI